LALWQANYISKLITESNREIEVEIKKIKTKGDRILDSPLAKIGDKGLFVKEIEVTLIDGAIDFAVHSMKDLPTDIPDELTLGATPKREDNRDLLISKNKIKLSELPPGTTIGTSSLRRKAQLLIYNPDLKIVDVRGNLDTRIRKMEEGQFEGIVLATAGVKRMGWMEKVTEIIDPSIILPAVGQGAIAIETRKNDGFIKELFLKINHVDTVASITAERALMKRLEGGCQVPIGASALVSNDRLEIEAMVSSLEGEEFIREIASGKVVDAEEIGIELAEKMISLGADKILKNVREQFES
ncbi:MAG: hydroxymethylbilane synthase, partial [Actinomycetia bacterium]|nr:hydroxymethylbilane synthase [Actinomycetes bacterium]